MEDVVEKFRGYVEWLKQKPGRYIDLSVSYGSLGEDLSCYLAICDENEKWHNFHCLVPDIKDTDLLKEKAAS